MLAATITPGSIQDTVRALPGVLTTATELTAKAAAVAPRAVPVLSNLLKLVPNGPALAPLVQHISADAATILRNAPSYAPTIRDVIKVLQAAPGLAPQIAAVTGPMADFTRRLGADPALGVFAARLVTIIELAQGAKRSGPPVPTAPTTEQRPGVGLAAVIPWLDRGITVMRHPWLLVAVPVAVLAGVGAIGYAVGRQR